MLRLAVALLLLAVLPVRANLGETVEDCVKRYGKPVGFTEANAKNPFGTVVFAAGPYQLLIFVVHDAEVGARVSKKDKSDFSPGEMKTIMDADATTPWTSVTSTDPNCVQWNRGDKSTVLYDKTAKMLIFTSPQMSEALRNPAAAVATGTSTPSPALPRSDVKIAPPVKTQWELAPQPLTNGVPAPAVPAGN